MDNITLVSYDHETQTCVVDRDMPFSYVMADKFFVSEEDKALYYRVIQYDYIHRVAFAVRLADE